MRICLMLMIVLLLFLPAEAVCAEEIPEDILHEVLLLSVSQDIGAFGAEAHTVLGAEQENDHLTVYLSAVAARYGFMNGACVEMTGWSGPCAVRFHRLNAQWQLEDFLEIEDYSELPGIFPSAIEKKFYADDKAEEREKEMRAAVQDNLQRLSRTEPLALYREVCGSLPNQLVIAGNLLPFDGTLHAWTLTCADVEREEQGDTVVYSKRWEQENGAPDRLETRLSNGQTYDWGGTTGTVVYEKTRKADGTVLETVRARETLTELTVDMQDAWGQIRYVFPLTEQALPGGGRMPGYEKPLVTCEGACRMDTVLLEGAIDALPGERRGQWEAESTVLVTGEERFTLYKDCCRHKLVCEKKTGDAWTCAWETEDLIPRTDCPLQMDCMQGRIEKQTGRGIRLQKDVVRIIGGDETPDVYIELSRDGDWWMVDTYCAQSLGIDAEVLNDAVLFTHSSLSADDSRFFWQGTLDRRADRFSSRDIWVWESETGNAFQDFRPALWEKYIGEGLMDPVLDLGSMAPLYALPGQAEMLSVYTAPDKAAPRAGKGKAAVSLKGPLAVLGREGEWACVVYEIGHSRYRLGWVKKEDSRWLGTVWDYLPEAAFSRESGKTRLKAVLWDDPWYLSGTAATVPGNAEVTVLYAMDRMCYVQYRAKDKVIRGFMENDALTR